MKELKDYLHLWKVIPKYPDYEASNFGEVRSKDKEVVHNYGGKAIKKGKILSKYINTGGYYCVGLTVNGKTKTIKNAILVAMAWHENPLNKKTVNHKDTNKLNDRESNLEWNTQRENVIHAIANNCRKDFSLSKNTIAKIVAKTSKPVTITNILTQKVTPCGSISMAAKCLFVSQSAISHALKRQSLVNVRFLIESGLAIDKTTLKQQAQ